MMKACKKAFPGSDILVMAAAVADYRPEIKQKEKIKKKRDALSLSLVPTDDILETLTRNKKDNQTIVGFALETGNALENARDKLKRKNMDMVVLNSLEDAGAGFGHSTNKVTIIDGSGNAKEYTLKDKDDVARDIVDFLGTIIKPAKR
jgi:phosphopantothenoylcysteine decarboxylase/phosphopantothenate--cysteine ligase